MKILEQVSQEIERGIAGGLKNRKESKAKGIQDRNREEIKREIDCGVACRGLSGKLGY